MSNQIDHTIPGEKWEFNSEVVTVFDDMLSRSIPQYDLMRKTVFDIACKYVKRLTYIVDIGCSRGNAIEPFIKKYGVNNTFLGLEISESMLTQAQEKFAGFIKTRICEIRKHDLRYDPYPPVSASVTLSILTLQFVPIEYRLKIVRDIYKSTVSGGAFIFVEKVIGATAEIDSLMVDSYLAMKSDNGYSAEEITRKRLSLEGVLVPVTARWNEEILKGSGFHHVDCFWRWMNFAGWIAIRE